MPEYWKNATVSYTTILSKSSNTQRKAFVRYSIYAYKVARKWMTPIRFSAQEVQNGYFSSEIRGVNWYITLLFNQIDPYENGLSLVLPSSLSKDS